MRTGAPAKWRANPLLFLSPASDRMVFLLRFEEGRHDMVPLQQLVKIGAVAIGDTSGLRDVAAGYLQQTDQIFLFEFAPRLGQGRNFVRGVLNRPLDQIGGDDRRRRQGDGLFDDVEQLADIAGPEALHSSSIASGE